MDEKVSKYRLVIDQMRSLAETETDVIALMANASALLYDSFRWLWVGFYRVAGDQLVLGPFQGPLACTRIGFGKGVCGTSWKERRSIVVPDVEQFPGHIACSSLSKSEIVVPLINNIGVVTAVLDIDSENLATFDQTDQKYLEEFAAVISEHAVF
ncbi:MAG: GAF domain-containing protein [Bacteroidales bacterium]|nr:GAF domain-containing protein [Bacteroidales bacterium]